MLISRAKITPPDLPAFEVELFGIVKNPGKSDSSAFCFFVSVTQEVSTPFVTIYWWTFSWECFESPYDDRRRF